MLRTSHDRTEVKLSPLYRLLTYLLTYSTEQSLFEKLIGFQQVQKFPWFYGTRMFITAFTIARPAVPTPNQLDQVHTPTSHFLKTHLNIILPSTPGSFKWSLSFRFPHQNPVHTSHLHPHALHAPPISFFAILSSEKIGWRVQIINPLKPELNSICYLLALLGAHHFLHVSRIRVKLLTFRRLMSYMYGAPILDVSRSHTTTQHSR